MHLFYIIDVTSNPLLLAALSSAVLHAHGITSQLGLPRLITFSMKNPMHEVQRRQNLSRRLIGRGRTAGWKEGERSKPSSIPAEWGELSTPDQAAGHVPPL